MKRPTSRSIVHYCPTCGREHAHSVIVSGEDRLLSCNGCFAVSVMESEQSGGMVPPDQVFGQNL